MRSAPDDRRDGEPAASAARRLPVRLSFGALLLCVVSFFLALVPYGARFSFSPALEGCEACVIKSEALAVAPAAPYATGFLNAAASAAGLSSSDFVLTCLQMLSIGTGYSYLSGEVSYGASNVNHTLELMIETAEYPDWDDLTAEQKNAWNGNESNYNAARFNSFMDAFGLAQARNTYYSTGGGNFGENEQSKLERIGAIGAKWATGVKESVETIAADIENVRTSGYLTRLTMPRQVEMNESLPYWPQGLSMNPVLNYGYDFRFTSSNNYVQIRKTNGPGVCLVGFRNNNQMQLVVASTEFFNYGTSPEGAYFANAESYTRDGKTVYFTGLTIDTTSYRNENVIVNPFTGGYVNTNTVAWAIIYGIPDGSGAYLPDAPMKQPADIQFPGDYAGSDKLGPGTSYPSLFDDEPGQPVNPPYVPPGPDERPENPYNPPDENNPGYQSGTTEWKDETSENMIPLMNIRFDKLFPFSMLYDIPKVANKVRNVTGTQINNGVYNRVNIPIWNPVNQSNMLVLDLGDLYSLLVMVRPFMQILLAAFLLFTAIAFWRNILTG